MNHPDATLTAREAYDKHYFKDQQGKLSQDKSNYCLTMWETLTDDPPIADISDETVEAFRTAALERYAPQTIVTIWRVVSAILRRVGPRETGNPSGLGIISIVPYMRPVKVKRKRPRRVHLDDITAVYVHAMTLKHPHRGYATPCDWWRALIVTAYTTGFRRGDLFALDWDDIDLEELTIDFQSVKTEKSDLWPLHPICAEHLVRIKDPAGGKVFKAAHRSRSGSYYKVMRSLCDGAGVGRFTTHDIRRTAASEIESVRRGMAEVFLQHAPRGVTEISYVNRHCELREVIEAMPLPTGFKAGPKSQKRRDERERKQRVELRLDELSVPSGPNPADWDFRYGQFAYQGWWHPMPSPLRLAILKLLVTNDGPVHYREIEALCREHGRKVKSSRWVHVRISNVRKRLQECLGLGSFDPVPCVSRGDGGAWTITIP